MKRTNLILLTFTTLFIAQRGLWAQTTDSTFGKDRIGLHLGLEHNLYLDELTTPLIYKGNGEQFGLDYHRQNTKSQLDISIDYAHLGEKSKYHQDRTLYITPLEFIPEIAINGDTVLHAEIAAAKLPHIGLRIAYYRKILSNRIKRVTTCVGGSFASNMRIPESDNIIVFSPVLLNEFNIAIKGSYEFNSKFKFSLGSEVPVFSLAVRLPYSLSPVEPNKDVYESAFSNGKIVTWDKYQSVRFFGGVDYELNKRITLQLNLSCYYLRYSFPKSIHFLQTNSTMGVSYSF